MKSVLVTEEPRLGTTAARLPVPGALTHAHVKKGIVNNVCWHAIGFESQLKMFNYLFVRQNNMARSLSGTSSWDFLAICEVLESFPLAVLWFSVGDS